MLKDRIPTISVVFFLFFFISKEIFSYDGERVVILCILTFIITAYYQLRSSIYLMLELRSAKIEEEFTATLNLKIKLEERIKEFWILFHTLETKITNVLFWFKSNIIAYLLKANKNRAIFFQRFF